MAEITKSETQPSQKTYNMKKVLFLALAAASFSFTSCDSKKEDTTEQAADNVEAAGEAKADAMEEKADAVRDSADATADKMEDAADSTDAK
ncbi:hypothetical protein [Hymenobacter sp. GOD-10R]|uniref:hypothetical protein n=1 Tax=Hymenobacter sp. GOD-10R TaxID=3093922 RepID=UPI002D794049|nr:hypothetical protein [Hymenobacter sp. GOD-10R]WRQ27815.1 hypothetical protein SD425_22330 [Hymenobacter sp. GOD-10R]